MDKKNKPRYMLSVLVHCLFLKTRICLGADTIFANQSLSRDQTIFSEGGIFEIGFHKPGNSSNHYICMWYKQIPERTIVWVANREKPVSDIYSSVLTISHGNLVLFDESQSPIWSTNLRSTTSSSVFAVLRDNGNLVLTNYGSKSPTLLWQSLDHPTHVWLPGSKFGYNNVTKRNQRIISWKTSEDPAPGQFSLEVDMSDKSFRILRNRSKSYWTSGSWNGMFFDKSPETKQNYNSQFRYFSNVNESYFIYSVTDNSTTSRFVMDVSGQVKQITWLGFWAQPGQQCQVYAFCGAFGSCYEKSLPFCNCLKGFVPKSQSDWDLEDYSGGCHRNVGKN